MYKLVVVALWLVVSASTPLVARQTAAVTDPVGDSMSASSAIDVTSMSAAIEDGELVVRLGLAGEVGPPGGSSPELVGLIDIDTDQNPDTGLRGWAQLESGVRSGALGAERTIDLFGYRASDATVALLGSDGQQVIARVPIAYSGSEVELRAPLALVDPDGRVDLAAVIGDPSDSSDIVPDQGALATGSEEGDLIALNGDRFEVEVEWRDFAGATGKGQLATRSDDSAIFYFFNPQNWEMLVKVLDACALNEHYWVLFSASTNVEFALSVTDRISGESKRYENPLGQAANAVTDTSALPVCP